MSEPYEVLAIRYGQWMTTKEHCYYRFRTYGEPDEELQMDFFFWLIRGNGRTILVDVGYSQEAVDTRPGRERLIGAREAVAAVGTDPESVSHIVVTHLHYDHTGNLPDFPHARLVVQREEVTFWTSRYVAQPPLASSAEPSEIRYVLDKIDRGEADVLDGPSEVVPGVRAVLVGGHTPGQQIVIVDNATPIVLASDALHFYEELERDRLFDIFSDLRGMYDGYALLRRLRDEGMSIIAGHDPVVTDRFEPVAFHDGHPLAVRLR